MKPALRFAAVLGVLAAFCLAAPTALAAWASSGTGQGGAAGATMPTGVAPTGSATGSSVTIRWPAVTLSNGAPVAGYLISRFNALNGSAGTVGPGCAGVVTTTLCTEQSVPSGAWIYTDTPVLLSWTGGASPASAPIVVP